MRILFLLHQFLPRHVTGTEQYARSLALELRRRGHDVRVFAYEPLIQFAAPGALRFEVDEEVDGIPVHRISVHPLASPNPVLIDFDNPLAVQLFERYLAANDFALAHVFHPRYLGCGGLAALERHGVPFVVNLMDFYYICANYMLRRRDGTLCEGPPDGGLGCVGCIDPALGRLVEEGGLGTELRRLAENGANSLVGLGSGAMERAHALVVRSHRLMAALARAQAVLAPSKFLQGLYERNGYAGPPLRHVPYGLDVGRFEVAEAAAREQSSTLRIGYVGSITPHKGLHTIVPVLRGLDGARPWRLDVHGSLATHPEYTAEVQELAGDDPRIRFHDAFAPDELGRVLAGLDVLVVPSLWYENTPFVVLEALWFGLPVIATRLGGIAEVVVDGRNGLLFEPDDADSLAMVLRRVLAEPELLSTLGQGPKPRTIDDNVDELLEIYAEVTAT